jgi:hypothetical protein
MGLGSKKGPSISGVHRVVPAAQVAAKNMGFVILLVMLLKQM